MNYVHIVTHDGIPLPRAFAERALAAKAVKDDMAKTGKHRSSYQIWGLPVIENPNEFPFQKLEMLAKFEDALENEEYDIAEGELDMLDEEDLSAAYRLAVNNARARLTKATRSLQSDY